MFLEVSTAAFGGQSIAPDVLGTEAVSIRGWDTGGRAAGAEGGQSVGQGSGGGGRTGVWMVG